MPCYSSVQTVILDTESLKKACLTLDIGLERHTDNRYTLRKAGEFITIERSQPGSKFQTVAYSGSTGFDTAIINPLVQEYAKVQLKKFAQKKGYVVSPGKATGEYVLTSLKG